MQDINPGVSGSNPVNLTVAGANLFFVAMDEFGTAQLFGGTTSIVLPVTDLSLHGKAVNEDVQLQWETLQEQHTKQFEVERGLDGRMFSYAGTLLASGNSTSLQQYAFTDIGAAHKGISILYYRLKMLDQDGRFYYSPVLPVKISESFTGALVYPNPVRNTASIIYQAASNEKLVYSLRDYNGRMWITNTITLQQGSNIFTINTVNIPAGLYVLTINGKNKPQHLKLVKQ